VTQLYATYATWVAGIKDWIAGYDFTDAQIQNFLALAQIRLNRDLMSYPMEKQATYVIVSSDPITLTSAVSDFNKVRLVRYPNVGSLKVLAINEMVDKLEQDPSTGTPEYYAVDAGKLYLHPVPSSTGATITVHYYQTVAPIAVGTNTNLFTTQHSDCLLYATLLEAAGYMAEDERIPVWEKNYVAAVKATNVDPSNIKKGSTPLVRRVMVG
jgi:hypothetical protein